MRAAMIMLMLISGAWATGSARPAAGGQPAPPQAGAHQATDSEPTIHQIITDIIRANIPAQYEDTRKWGGTKEMVRGLKVSLDGLKVKTKRRRKEVNHGTWKRYNVQLLDPDQQFHIQLKHIGPTSDGRLSLSLAFQARLAAFGRLSQWHAGVQLISLSLESEATVTLDLTCEIGLKLVTDKFPPDILVEPEVTEARLELIDFRVRRISKASGPLAKQLSHGLKELIRDKIEEKQQKLVQDLNRQINKRPDRLRLSLRDEFQSVLGALKQR